MSKINRSRSKITMTPRTQRMIMAFYIILCIFGSIQAFKQFVEQYDIIDKYFILKDRNLTINKIPQLQPNVNDELIDSQFAYLKGKVNLVERISPDFNRNIEFLVTHFEHQARNRPGRFRMSRWLRQETLDDFQYRDAQLEIEDLDLDIQKWQNLEQIPNEDGYEQFRQPKDFTKKKFKVKINQIQQIKYLEDRTFLSSEKYSYGKKNMVFGNLKIDSEIAIVGILRRPSQDEIYKWSRNKEESMDFVLDPIPYDQGMSQIFKQQDISDDRFYVSSKKDQEQDELIRLRAHKLTIEQYETFYQVSMISGTMWILLIVLYIRWQIAKINVDSNKNKEMTKTKND